MTETKQALDAVCGLVEKWQNEAARIAKPYGFVTENAIGSAGAMEACADDLAALLPALREQVEQLQAALGEAGKDSERLDALEAEVASGGSLTLHNGEGANGGRGLGLSNTGRTLRQAIDQCCGLDAMAAGEDA